MLHIHHSLVCGIYLFSSTKTWLLFMRYQQICNYYFIFIFWGLTALSKFSSCQIETSSCSIKYSLLVAKFAPRNWDHGDTSVGLDYRPLKSFFFVLKIKVIYCSGETRIKAFLRPKMGLVYYHSYLRCRFCKKRRLQLFCNLQSCSANRRNLTKFWKNKFLSSDLVISGFILKCMYECLLYSTYI